MGRRGNATFLYSNTPALLFNRFYRVSFTPVNHPKEPFFAAKKTSSFGLGEILYKTQVGA
jgi:hypothetical protein